MGFFLGFFGVFLGVFWGFFEGFFLGPKNPGVFFLERNILSVFQKSGFFQKIFYVTKKPILLMKCFKKSTFSKKSKISDIFIVSLKKIMETMMISQGVFHQS